MTSTDTAAGRTFEERTAKLSLKIAQILQVFSSNRTAEYQASKFQFTGSDWATNKHTDKTVTIPKNTYTFSKIDRTTNGDWKGGPVINGVDRSTWKTGDIPGGSVTWTTGGHGKASTKWAIDGKYADIYIINAVADEVKQIKLILNSQNLPSE
jgi:hypothetical protein